MPKSPHLTPSDDPASVAACQRPAGLALALHASRYERLIAPGTEVAVLADGAPVPGPDNGLLLAAIAGDVDVMDLPGGGAWRGGQELPHGQEPVAGGLALRRPYVSRRSTLGHRP